MRCQEMQASAASGGVSRRSLCVAPGVGTILNLINRGDALVTGRKVELALIYVVPYGVCAYGAVSFRLHAAGTAGRHG